MSLCMNQEFQDVMWGKCSLVIIQLEHWSMGSTYIAYEPQAESR